MNATAPTPADIVRAIFADLSDWCGQYKGVCGLTQNPYDLFEILKVSPSGWRITIHWEGDEPASESVRRGGVQRHRLRFILDGDLGPTAIPKIALIRETASRTPFLELLEHTRVHLRSYRFPWLSPPNDRMYDLGADDKVPLPDGMFLAAYNVSFGLVAPCHMPDAEILLRV